MQKAITQRMAATGMNTAAAYRQRLAEDGVEAEVLLASLKITYSEFFRNPLTFALLEQLILPSRLEANGTTGQAELRVWSAGCAAGQEAWSIAILLEDLAQACGRPIPSRIIATDISEAALAFARQGVYDTAAVQNVRLKHLQKYFIIKGDAYAIIPALKNRVDFSTYDLLDVHSASPATGIYGDFDLVFCSNLLFYYRMDIRQQILDKVCRALAPGGFLVTGEAERDLVAKHDGLRAVAPPAPIFQKRKQF